MRLETDDSVTVSKVRECEDGSTTIDTKLMSAMSDVSDIHRARFHSSDDSRTVCEFNKVNLEAFFFESACLNCSHYGAERCIVWHICNVESLERRSCCLFFCSLSENACKSDDCYQKNSDCLFHFISPFFVFKNVVPIIFLPQGIHDIPETKSGS